jgi:glucose-6-phosphate dehydrogenase assembly protein OpcA
VSTNTVHTQRQSVDLRQVPQALGTIWRDICTTETEGHVSRSLIANFLAIGDAARETELREVLSRIVTRVPCRAFLITLADTQGTIEASVSGTARIFGKSRDLVLEQIDLRASHSSFDQLAGLVRPLLVNDLPTHLYWATDWPSDPRPFDLFTVMAEHTIIDSARFQVPAAHLDAVQSRRQRGRTISDLNWLRLRPYRRALAEAFERFYFNANEPTNVSICCGEHGLAAATLCGKWLELKLAARVQVELDDSTHISPAHIELQHGKNLVQLTWTEHGQLEVHVTTSESCFLPFTVPASRGTESSLLAAAIDLA